MGLPADKFLLVVRAFLDCKQKITKSCTTLDIPKYRLWMARMYRTYNWKTMVLSWGQVLQQLNSTLKKLTIKSFLFSSCSQAASLTFLQVLFGPSYSTISITFPCCSWAYLPVFIIWLSEPCSCQNIFFACKHLEEVILDSSHFSNTTCRSIHVFTISLALEINSPPIFRFFSFAPKLVFTARIDHSEDPF